jgi:hypothetical protein
MKAHKHQGPVANKEEGRISSRMDLNPIDRQKNGSS